MQLFFLVLGFFLLFVGSFLDNLRGPLLPMLSDLFRLAYSESSLFLALGNIGAVIATFALLFLKPRFRERTTVFGVILFGVGSGLLSYTVQGKGTLFLLAFCLGATIASFGAMSNLLIIRGTDSKWRGPVFCGLHTMYGLGSLTAPLVLSSFQLKEESWRNPLVLVSSASLLAFPLFWRKLSKLPHEESRVPEAVHLNPFQGFIVVLVSTYVIGEVMASAWMVTYLVKVRSFSVADASWYLSGFFLTIAVTRGALFLSFKERHESLLLISSVAFSAVFFLIGLKFGAYGFVFAGVLGPFFPVFLSRLSRLFPKQANTLVLWILGTMQIAQFMAHKWVGWTADNYGMDAAYWIPFGVLCLTNVLLLIYFKCESRLLIESKRFL